MTNPKTAGPPLPVLLTRREAAERARVSTRTLDEWIARGELPVTKVHTARRVFIDSRDLVALLHRTVGGQS